MAMAEYVWQFHIADNEPHVADGGKGYFELQASATAIVRGCQLVSSHSVKLEHWQNTVMMVTGTAVLDDEPAANPV